MKVKKFFRLIITVILSLTLLISGIALAAENLLLYTEIDAPDKLTVYSNHVSYTNLTRSDESYVYYDKGEGYFNGDFIIDFDYFFSDGVGATVVASIFTLANVIDDYWAIVDADGDMLAITISPYAAFPDTYTKLKLTEYDGGDFYGDSIDYEVNINETVYVRVARNEGIGTYGTAYLYIYSDSERTNLLGSTSLALHSSLKDYQYYYPIQANNTGDASWCSGDVANIDIIGGGGGIPEVVTNPKGLALDGAYLSGWGSTVNGELLTAGFEIGIESSNYTDNKSASINQNYFSVIVPNDDLEIGETYYFRAYATNNYGVGFGNEKSFLYNPTILTLTVDTPLVVQDVTGNFTASFLVTLNQQLTDNVTFALSPNYPPYTDNITTYLNWAGDGMYLFSTWNGSYGTQGVLSENTTYYYQGIAYYEDVQYSSAVGSFTTTTTEIPDKPSVNIITVQDVSVAYNADYVFEAIAKITTSNTTNAVNSWGFQISLSSLPDGNLLPPIYNFPINWTSEDGTYSVVLLLDNADWYAGETLYFRAFIKTAYYGMIYSPIVDIKPIEDVIGDTGDTPPDVIDTFADMVNNVKVSMHLTGIMGTWAFMGLCILITSLLFGIAMLAVPIGIAKMAVGVAWLLVSTAILGAFIFTGELGIWPILILVGGVVALIIIVLSVKLSGGGMQNG